MIFVLDSEFSVTDLCSDFHKCISVDVFHLGSVRFSLAWGNLFVLSLSLFVSLVPENKKLKKIEFFTSICLYVLPNLTKP